MKKSEIKVGGHYVAKVSDELTTVRVDRINQEREPVSGTMRTGKTGRHSYDVTNLATGRTTTFHSAIKFRREVVPNGQRPIPAAVQGVIKRTAPDLSKALGYTEETPQADPTHGSSAETPVTSAANCPTPAPAIMPYSVSPAVAPNRLTGLAAKLSAAKPVEDNAPHLIVEARAGTGKTTTLVEGLKRMRGMPSTLTPSLQQAAVWESMALSSGARTVCFVAFNKSIAEELKSRVPPGCEACTMHSMGFRAVLAAFPSLRGRRMNDHRTQDIVAAILGRDIWDLRKEKIAVLQAVEKLVGLCKMNLVGVAGLLPESSATYKTGLANGNAGSLACEAVWEYDLDQMARHYDVELNGSRAEVFSLVPKVLEVCKDPNAGGMIDFADMIWLPVVLNLPLVQYDVLLWDESQDGNKCQQQLALRAGKRLVLCGDRNQAIYGFAGADSAALDNMEKLLTASPRGCVTLPLTVTRRCGRAIVAEANKIVPDFHAHETCPEGKVSQARYPARGKDGKPGVPWEASYGPTVQAGDMVLCRVNAPLVSQCFRFLKDGRKAGIQGRDIGAGLVSTVKKLKADSIPDLLKKIGEWERKESEKEQAKRNPSEARLIAITDRADCLLCFTDGSACVEDAVRRIEAVFTDDKASPGIRLSSVHKAKGLESRHVYILLPEKAGMPHPMAKSAWQRDQEMNLKYVAITRAIEELTWVS
ncbi:MAG: UvrD-helicase domain-containing protein [Dehalococcoidia bacterium]|nr:UvrD-helicase domain-containing protein [Dehalococcoidia bacterium]